MGGSGDGSPHAENSMQKHSSLPRFFCYFGKNKKEGRHTISILDVGIERPQKGRFHVAYTKHFIACILHEFLTNIELQNVGKGAAAAVFRLSCVAFVSCHRMYSKKF